MTAHAIRLAAGLLLLLLAAAASVATQAPADLRVTRVVDGDTIDVERIYVTRTGERYHRDGCRSLARSRIRMELAAAAQRYTPRALCRPPASPPRLRVEDAVDPATAALL